MDSTDKLLADIERFLKKTGMTQSHFGREAVEDSGFVSKLRNGRSPSLRVADRIYNYMAKYKKKRNAA